MNDEKTLRVGTVNLSELCRGLHQYEEMQSRIQECEEQRNKKVSDLEKKFQADFPQASPSERLAMVSEVNAWKSKQAEEVHAFAVGERHALFAQIQGVIRKKAEQKGFDLVLDTAEVCTSGFPSVLFSREELDITQEIIHAMNAAV
ncbi:MAG: OmpH family outer membrane protein [Chthoniobacterales bacterium]